ncbi:uncharacterized protein GIQ15_01762 [Arthroderma uncinatum]|uniref:uncharacterized protein n=1 Tax=Arthroderma uncinatum TaxID=74035 RepID=UPI00144AF832|nr:uncharacterized protein GIQ15_01762 [Arthroderma uncinatum]KAF3492245.1 hypothetical protein GIQ15_01762 [Arthroderma uncinatum]
MVYAIKIALGTGTSTDSLLSFQHYPEFPSGKNAPVGGEAVGQKGFLSQVMKPVKTFLSLFYKGTAQQKAGDGPGDGTAAEGEGSEESGPLRDCYKVVAYGRKAPLSPLGFGVLA